MLRFEPRPGAPGLRIELPQADLYYWSRWVAPELADRWFEQLVAETPWEQPTIRLYGKTFAVPRQVAWYGDPEARYRYSGLVHEPLPWTDLLAEIRDRVQLDTGSALNAVLLNLYRDGQDAMGWHSDDEPELGAEPVVVSLNLGATRRFDLRRKGVNRIEHSLSLEHGSLLVMSGSTQHHWQHQIARTRKVASPRLNLTFRRIIREYPA